MTRSLVLAATLCCLALSAAQAQVVGWRTDWTGRYPDADPPTRWSATESVLWKCPLPSWSNATPVIVGRRIFVCSEPASLLCVDADSGRILWQRENTYLDALPEAEAKQARELLAKIDLDKLVKQQRQALSKVSRLKRDLEKAPNDEAIKKQIAEAETQAEKLTADLEPVKHLIQPEHHAVAGFTTPTPVSDGKRVWVFFGNGLAACYDLEGNRLWSRLVEKPTITYAHSPSPLLVGDKLILQIHSLFTLDAATGQTLWKSDAEECWGTGVVVRAGQHDLIITSNAEVFDAANGKKLATGACKLRFSQPIVDSGIVYFIEARGKAYRLGALDGPKPKELWTTKPNAERRYASPVIHEGIIYTLTEKGVLSAIDASNGAVIYEQNLGFADDKHIPYPSLSAAGRYVYASCESGTTVVIQCGREFKEVGRNTLEPFRSCLVFQDKRLYIRTLKNLYCFGS